MLPHHTMLVCKRSSCPRVTAPSKPCSSPDLGTVSLAGHLKTALERVLPQHGAEHDSGKAQHVLDSGRANWPSQLGQHVNSAASNEQALRAEAASDLAGTAVPVKRPAHLTHTGASPGRTDEHADADSRGHSEANEARPAGDAHMQLHVDSNSAMTEATAQRLIEALNNHHTGLEQTSRTLSEASTHLRDVCLLLKGPRHRF